MYYVNNIPIYNNGITYREIYSDETNVSNGKYDVQEINNTFSEELYKVNVNIVDLSDNITYLRVLASIYNDDKYFFEKLNTILIKIQDTNTIILANKNENNINSCLYEFSLYLKKFGFNGYYLPNTIDVAQRFIKSHIYLIK